MSIHIESGKAPHTVALHNAAPHSEVLLQKDFARQWNRSLPTPISAHLLSLLRSPTDDILLPVLVHLVQVPLRVLSVRTLSLASQRYHQIHQSYRNYLQAHHHWVCCLWPCSDKFKYGKLYKIKLFFQPYKSCIVNPHPRNSMLFRPLPAYPVPGSDSRADTCSTRCC